MHWKMLCPTGTPCQAGHLDKEQGWLEWVSSPKAWMEAGPPQLGPRTVLTFPVHLPWSFDACLPIVHADVQMLLG